MKLQIKDYLKELNSEIQECYSDEINLQEADFEKYEIFDFVNFHLIYQYILDDKSNKNDFFVSVPEDGYRENFFASIFHSIVLIKLYQNFFNYEKLNPPLEKNDLVYSHSKKRVYRVVGKNSSGLTLEYKFPRRNERGARISIRGHKFYKLNPNLSNGRNTAKNIDNYASYLSNMFGESFSFITDFKNRTLVIAGKQFFKESKHLPIRYTNKNGKIKNDLPFFNYMVECCNDFNSAQSFLLNQNQKFDEVIIIRDSKYREDFDFILQEKYRDKYKNIIVIGTEKPNTECEFLEWWWSNDEVKIANDEIPNSIKKVTLTNDDMYSLFTELKSEIQNIKEESQVNLSFLLKYTNFFCRAILVNTNLSKGIFQEYLDRLNRYFQSESFSEELNNLFYEKDIYNPSTIGNYTNRIFNIFSKITNMLENENLKWNYIKQRAKDVYSKSIYVVVEKKNYDAISNQIKNEKIRNIKLISDKRIDISKLYLDKWLNDNQNSPKKQVIVPYLNSMELYIKIKAIKGNCEVICYKDLDEISFDNVEQTYYNQEKIRLTHSDRKTFFKTDFNHITQVKKRYFDDVFSFDLNSEKFKENPYELSDLPKERAIYDILFSDGTNDKFDSTKGVFLIESGEQIKTTIGESYINSTIRFYQNNSKEDFRKVLKIFDTENLLDSFDEYSNSWKETLKKLTSQYGSSEKLYEALFTSYKINYNTFRNYLNENSETRFPRTSTMEVIRNFCLKNNRSNDLIVTEFERFKIYAKKDHSIRQQAGKILGSDLLDYVASNKEEKSDSLNKLPENILEKLTDTIQEKTIIKKTLIDE